ncbi:DUF6252 family protein [Flavobacterium sp. 7A]|uniref:DUF6252 family protein n=1 Tax=Flavobacterium sp. 7A TaxID=2940571 RepID=UPI00222617CB|nr:DUF6252 family protein [Flavobacterium sp. 7A]MCW2118147.1 hypothetical protein [Flavobacterium sp. 7A]
MKKYFLFLLTTLSIFSCEENVKFNNPSFQGLKDNVFWRAITTTATINSSNELIITAYTSKEQIVLKTPSDDINTYTLGEDNISTATYTLTEDTTVTTYSTGTNTGNGQIEITEYDIANKIITGTFKFNAINTITNPESQSNLNFQQGVFYKIPVTP